MNMSPITKLTALLLTSLMLLSFKCGSSAVNVPPVAVRQSVSSYFSEKDFNDFFPMRDKFYTYKAFIQAINELGQISIKVEKHDVSIYKLTRTDARTGKSTVVRQDEDWNEDWAQKKPYSTYNVVYANFCAEKDITTNKKELAAFFAQIAHETRHGENGKYNDGLMYTHELNTTLPYIADNDNYPPVKGKNYYGRGPVQLSYNGNYGYASDCIFGNKSVLLNNPDLITTDAVVAFKTAIYFWMTPQALKPSAHNVMIGNWKPTVDDTAKGRVPGFGMTINIVNGAVECNKGDNVFSMNDRIGYYQYFLKRLGVKDDNCVCSCGKMQPYQ
jgi:predicted chitinase